MIFTRLIDNEEWYHVCNDYGDCLIHTRSRTIAYFVHQHSYKVPRGMYLKVGGDRVSSRNKTPHHHVFRSRY